MNKYAYIHIEKCAGTSLHKILELNDSRYWVLNPKVFYTNGIDYPITSNDTKRVLNSYFVNGIGGHAIRPYRLEYDQLSRSFTFLRNPNERYVSHFIHQKYKMGIKMSFEDYLTNDYYKNFITKSLSLHGDFEEAKECLLKIGYVGVMEDFNRGVRELNSIVFNNKLKIYKNHEMKSVSSELATEIMKKYSSQIDLCNRDDWMLYNEAISEIFRARYNIQEIDEEITDIGGFKDFKRKVLRLIKNKIWYYL